LVWRRKESGDLPDRKKCIMPRSRPCQQSAVCSLR
jgi:hypothetical protein